MLLAVIRWAFERLIGTLTPAAKATLTAKLEDLLKIVVEAAAEGAVRGGRSR